MHLILGVTGGFVVGCFCPAVCREVKSWFSKETKAVVTDVTKKL